MRNCYRRVLALLLTALLSVSLTGCVVEEENTDSLSVCIGSGALVLDPIYAETVNSQTVLVHLYENLMRITADDNGETTVIGGAAKDVEIEEHHDGSVTYTFQLRNAKWSDGEKVKAQDFVYAWQRLADPSSHSPYAALLSVVCGYQEARNSGDMSQLQVIAKNDNTLVVTLAGNYDWFLKDVCTSPATMPLRKDVVQKLKEAGANNAGGSVRSWWADPVALVVNGPYKAVDYDAEAFLKINENSRYTVNLSGPEEIVFHIVEDESGWALYQNGGVDAVWPLAEERLVELSADETWTPIAQLSTYTVVYNCADELLADARIRQAISLAVDRNMLSQTAGITAVPAEGLVPNGVPENEEGDFRTMGGPLLDNDPALYPERCKEAAALLSEAGYNSGADLQELEYLYVDEGKNGDVAQLLCQQWQDVLGIRIKSRGVTTQEMWEALRTGGYVLAGVELTAPANDAECFLMDWTSDSQDNVAAYENSAYDTLMSIIASAPDGTARMGCLHDAEVLLMSDYALLPLYTEGTAWELRENWMGALRDARGWFTFSETIRKPT